MKKKNKLQFIVLLLIFKVYSLSAQDTSFFEVPLNGTWAFKTDLYHEGEEKGWYKTSIDTADWETMPVPGNWDLKNQYADYVGTAWYRRTFEVPETWKNKGIRLVFEAVYNDAKIWINGEEIGEHHVGFLPFWFDIDPYLKFGEKNSIVVKANNTFKRGAIWNWGGIRRPVWLEVTNKARLVQQHITATPDLDKGTAQIETKIELLNRHAFDVSVGYQVEIIHQGEVVWQSSKKLLRDELVIPSSSSRKANVSFTLPRSKVNLWHFDQPELYTCKTILYMDGAMIHQLEDRFGIRKVEVDGYDFKLNGEVIRTVGFNWVPEDRTTGSTLPLWRIKKDIDLMKELGANMARLSHLPLPKAALDYLDQKGIMVFEEVSLWGKDVMVDPEHPLPKYWLEKMIKVKYNHPSIIGWSVGNEIGYLNANPKAMEYVQTAVQNAKALDPNRLAVYISHSVHRQENDPVKYSDIIMYNAYGEWGENVEKINQLHPGKPIFMAEYGNHLNDVNPNLANIDAAKMLNEFRGKEYMLGASLWTFNDYRSFWKAGPTWTTPPSQNRTWGVVNVYRQKKMPFYTFKRQYAPVEDLKVHITGREAKLGIVPRGKLDIPAYPLHNYHLVWHSFDENGDLIEGGTEKLPDIFPGDSEINKIISWTSDQRIKGIKIALLDPQMYSRIDTTIYFVPPAAPEITNVSTSNNQVRVVFKTVPNATEYKIKYGKDQLDQETMPTINNFMEVTDLVQFEEYQFSVTAINNAGEGKPSALVKAKTDEDELPPIIWETIPFNDNFFIGYSVDRLDYLYDIQYGKNPGAYEKQIGLRNVGVIQIPDLDPGQTYYYRIRNRKQWGFASEWSHEVAVNLIQENCRVSVKPKGSIKSDDGWLLLFDPVDKAIGYEISYREEGSQNWQKTFLNKALADYVLLQGLNPNRSYQFKVEALIDLNRYHTLNQQEISGSFIGMSR